MTTGPQSACVDGNEAAAQIAHLLSDVVAIYPITPASGMGELADAWSAAGRTNLWGAVPEVVQMQSEAGAAGALHGAILKGTLGTSFTASQGLLLMLPNMYKIAGELTPAVIHVAARTLATHALSIFGDHSDVMAARGTGWAMLCSASVQEAHDFAAVAHAATLTSRVPFLHFFDGFRTSHEIDRITLLPREDVRGLVDEGAVSAHRASGLSPDAPTIRGTAQNPDVFFQAREAANRFHDAVPETVQTLFDDLADRTGRRYGLVDYAGAPDADRVLVLMGSGAGAATETVEALAARGEKVGVCTVRLYRPFPAAQLLEALPATARRVMVLDRTKEPGAVGDPLYTDVIAALAEGGRGDVLVTAGRYGLGGKEFNPAMVKGLFDELGRDTPRRHVTVGIVDDVTGLSVDPDPSFTVPQAPLQAVFYGLGSDGTVGANKATVKMVGRHTDLHAQGYFVYDSKKAGSITVSHLRFGPDPIRSTYLIDRADFVAVHQFPLLMRRRVLDTARQGAIVLLNSSYPAEKVWSHLPVEVQQGIIDRDLKLYVVDAYRIARDNHLAGRINTVMQTCFFALVDLLPTADVEEILCTSARQAYGSKGGEVVARNVAAIGAALGGLERVAVPSTLKGALRRMEPLPGHAPRFVREVTALMLDGDGDLLPVSAMPVDGVFPTNTARWEKRGLATEAPVWDADLCTGCGKCTIVCPHAAIRMAVFDPAHDRPLPEQFPTARFTSRELPGHRLTLAVSPLDCTACGLCVEACPVADKLNPAHKALLMEPIGDRLTFDQEHFAAVEELPQPPRSALKTNTVKGSQLLEPLFTFSGACSGCGETPYLKLLSQLAGDRLILANATGCSSIFGGNLPTTPWSTDACGRGPAWANSLFEDNAEFGLGIRLAADHQHNQARELLARCSDAVGTDLAARILDAPSDGEDLSRLRRDISRLKLRIAGLDPADGSDLARLSTLADELVDRTVWIIGGDGWAHDIGFGGLDHVLASGRNVNILVLDTEVYSNTGGQASKATPRGAIAKFASGGKGTQKKDLGRFALTYRDVYVAQIALGGNEIQTVRALQEAQQWPGVSLVIAYASCIEHGIEMVQSLHHQKAAVTSGHWPLYRSRPATDERPAAFSLDSKPPTRPVREFALAQTRFARLQRTDPTRSEHLLTQMQQDTDDRWAHYHGLASPTP
ncbi:pyruvate:ferredoxin (flavodoxin) oxidoreductase [Tessaracoccus sp. G1721]